MELDHGWDILQKGFSSMTSAWRILLVDDNEDDYYLARAMLSEARGAQFILEWASTYEKALDTADCDSLDAILVDYDLGSHNGIDLVRALIKRDCRAPIILLTGRGSYELDVEAMKVGVADYLSKNEINAPFLERAIRYAIERKQTEEALRQSNERLETINNLLAKAKEELKARVEERTREIQQANTRFRTIFEESDLGIKLVDLNGRILATNPAFREMVGYREEELSQMRFSDLTYEVDAPNNQELFSRLASGEIERFRIEKRYRTRNGVLLWVRQNTSLVRGEKGVPQFAIAMVENITERKQIESELSEVQRRLMDSREEERMHLSQELHDGPMQALYGLIYELKGLQEDLVSEQPGQGNGSEHPNRREQAFQQLVSMQDTASQTVQELRAICTELRPPALAPFGLEKAIRSYIENLPQKYPDIQIDLDLEPDGQTLSERVRLALFRIFQHAVSNAARHARSNKIEISLHLEEEHIKLKIQDQGQGFTVPGSWIEFVRQGHLGLAGASERAQAIGGTLNVTSEPGKGTIVEVVVPRTQLAAAQVPESTR